MTGEIPHLYDLLRHLDDCLGGSRVMAECNGKMDWPHRGVYFFLDPNEPHENGPGGMRVVRVGTHALTPGSKSTLWGRLRTHRGTLSGGGNHRASVFRRHVGEALVAKYPDKHVASSWNQARPQLAEAKAEESLLEHAVSGYIGALRLLWLAVPDTSGTENARAYIEKNAIALLAKEGGSASDQWLGNSSPHPVIQSIGLWNVSEVTSEYDIGFISRLETYVKATTMEGPHSS